MSTPAGYFSAMYADAEDPWRLDSRWYEQRKYAITVASLSKAVYASAFEPGCSVGVLTALVAPRCRALLSCDRSERAVAAAARRVGDLPHVRVEHRVIPGQWPEGRFDLIVLSELLYYFDPPGVREILARARQSLEPGGTLVAVHWRHPVPDHAQSGDDVHRTLRATEGLVPIAAHQEADFLLDTMVVPARAGDGPASLSVAAAEGLT